eukprot:scaffold10953_cov60-Phaeocystis_antarctica.AAC.2
MVLSRAALNTRGCQNMHGLLLHRDRRTAALGPRLGAGGRSAHGARSRGRRCTFVGLTRRVVGRHPDQRAGGGGGGRAQKRVVLTAGPEVKPYSGRELTTYGSGRPPA